MIPPFLPPCRHHISLMMRYVSLTQTQSSFILTWVQFFDRLGELFASRKGKDHGSVQLTQKRRMPSLFLTLPLALPVVTQGRCLSVCWLVMLP